MIRFFTKSAVCKFAIRALFLTNSIFCLMKKSLITAALALCFAAVTNAATVITATPTATGVSPSATAIVGWTINFATGATTYSEDVSTADVLNLTTITLNTTSDLTNVKLAVYLVDDVPATGWNTTYNPTNFKSFVGMSNAGTSTGFTFSDSIAIDPNTGWYAFMLVNTSATAETLSSGSNLTTTAFNAKVETKNIDCYATGTGVAWASMINRGNKAGGWNNTQTVNATYTFASPTPEPTTGSLSLLGLAALAMRRRRA